MKDNYTRISLVRLCRLLGITRQSYYQYFWQQEASAIEDQLVIDRVLYIRKNHRSMGGRKLYELLQPFLLEHQIKLGRDALFNLLSANGLLIKRRRRYSVTTFSNHWLKKWPNLIREKVINNVNELWVSDITYWKIGRQHTYISLITDAYSHKVVGCHIAETLESVETIKALQMALKTIPGKLHHQLIHHSDRGIQYCSSAYVKLLQDKGIQISMTENGDPLENAIAERINGILKNEYLKYYEVDNIKDARKRLHDAVRLYNEQRPHMSIGMLCPQTVHDSNLKTDKLWKNYYEKNRKIVNVFQDLNQPVKLSQD
ncbi:MAG TPA: IS3 family transposase [Mucilaginibacter sp.]|jgi:transposase InsO family protein|nr:IS3 family transposase [Mucilaginibacter sp.]